MVEDLPGGVKVLEWVAVDFLNGTKDEPEELEPPEVKLVPHIGKVLEEAITVEPAADPLAALGDNPELGLGHVRCCEEPHVATEDPVGDLPLHPEEDEGLALDVPEVTAD
jgi:hypothetical protein